MDQNTKRGMSRIFIILAMLWVIGMGWYQFSDGKQEENSMTISMGNDTELRIDASGIQQQDKNQEQMQKIMFVFLPGLVLLLVVPVLGWVSKGFKVEGQ